MDIKTAIRAVMAHQNLPHDNMTTVMRQIMTGEATPAQIGGFLVGLAMKGESVTEIAAAAKVMRTLAIKVASDSTYLIDTCGTGGDGSTSFNISTASAFVAAAAGARVAKHGNRSLSGKSGSADVLEAAGVRLDLSPTQISQCIRELGIGFIFAPLHHGAMKHAIGPRREMAVRTIFNLLGPLTNPAAAPNQLIGVFDPKWVKPLADVLAELGSEHVLVVHADDGLDEISAGCETQIAELNAGNIHCYRIAPEQFGIERRSMDAVRVGSAADSLAIITRVFRGEPGVARDVVLMNAAAAIYVAGLATSLEDGVHQAASSIDNGHAQQRFEQLVQTSQRLGAALDNPSG